MEKNFVNYKFEELAKDEKFRSWVLHANEEGELFWTNWLINNPDQQNKVALAKVFLQALEEKDTSLNEEDLDLITEQILIDSSTNSNKKPVYYYFKWAALLFVFLGLGISVYYFNNFGKGINISESSPLEFLKEGFVEKTNTTNTNQKIILEDNSSVNLFPNSKIRYSNLFSKKNREVYLEGKAFFDITKNPNRPFWVFTDDISTQVLGTSFTVSSFPENEDVSVQVKSGKVSVYTRRDLVVAKNLKKKILPGVILTPNQQAFFLKSETRLIKSIVENPQQLVEIKKEAFIFEETPVFKIFALLEKVYGISIIFDAKNMELCYLTANLEEETLFEKLDLICKITHSSYEKLDSQIIIYSKGCNN